MKRGTWLIAALFVSLGCSTRPQRPVTQPSLTAADEREAIRDSLRQLLAPLNVQVPADLGVNANRPSRELRLVWEQNAGVAPGRETGRVSMLASEKQPDPPPRLRSVDLSEGQLLVVGVDAHATLRSWSVIPDPRFVRSEVPDAEGVLTGKTVAIGRAEFLVSIPDDERIVEVRLYQPHAAQGPGFVLELLGRMRVADQQQER